MKILQDYLKNNGLLKIQEELGVNVVQKGNLLLLNYHQINSPKTHPVIRETRSIILDVDFNLVARSFSRFYNWGEVLEDATLFDWSNFIAQEKVDGSFILLFYYADSWQVCTRNTFGDGVIRGLDKTWKEAVLKILGSTLRELPKELTYTFEYVGLANQVVKLYPEEDLYLLTVFEGNDELCYDEVEDLALYYNLVRPEIYTVKNLEDTMLFLSVLDKDPDIAEGMVIRDSKNNRWKLKTDSYNILHKLSNNNNILLTKNLIHYAITNTYQEIVKRFPATLDKLTKLIAYIALELNNLKSAWHKYKHLEYQKDFALAIKDEPLKHILFRLRSKKVEEPMWEEELVKYEETLAERFDHDCGRVF